MALRAIEDTALLPGKIVPAEDDGRMVDPGDAFPPAVRRTKDRIVEAMSAGDFEALNDLTGPGFSYSFGFEPGRPPLSFWQDLRASLKTIIKVLDMPPTKVGDTYIWPFAYDGDLTQLSEEEHRLLLTIATEEGIRSWIEFGGYIGWRVGIASDGIWRFCIAGD